MALRAILVTLALVLGASPVAADAGITWQAPDGCPAYQDVRRRIEHRLGGSIDGVVHGIEIAITREGEAFVATIDARALTVANDLRTLRSARCEELADAIAVIVARLAVDARMRQTAVRDRDRDHDHDLDLDPDPDLDLAAAPIVAGSAPPRGREAGPRGREAAATRWGGGGRALAVTGIGALPQVNVGGELAGHVRRDHTFLELAVARWIPEGHVARAPSLRLDVATVRLGWRPTTIPLRAWVTGELGSLARADLATRDSRRWTALGAGFGVAWPMAPSARLVGTIELAVPLERGGITQMMPPTPVPYQPGVAAARCAFGLEIGWP